MTTAADIDSDVSYLDIDWRKPRLLVFGSEAFGLEEDERSTLDEIISIPMKNGVESLNLAVSCGIILFEGERSVSHVATSTWRS